MDEYERRYMAESGDAVVHRQKAVLPRWVVGIAGGLPGGIALVISLVLFGAGTLSIFPALAVAGGGALYAALMTLLMVATGVARVMVTTNELHAQIGTGDVKIPLAEIRSASVTDAGTRNRGIGVRLRGGSRVYNMLGDPREAVKIERAGDKPVFFVVKDPEGLADAVNRACTKVRVEVDATATERAVDEHEVEVAVPARGASSERE